jgi:hypothetical protein
MVYDKNFTDNTGGKFLACGCEDEGRCMLYNVLIHRTKWSSKNCFTRCGTTRSLKISKGARPSIYAHHVTTWNQESPKWRLGE